MTRCVSNVVQIKQFLRLQNLLTVINRYISMNKIRPLHDRILVERVEQDTKTKGGIIIPDNAKEKPMQGKVIEVGEGARDSDGKLIPMSVKKGDTVLFAKWGGNEVTFDGKEYLFIKESDVLAIVS